MDTMKNLWRSNKGFLLFIGLMFVFRSAVADWNLVPSSSMNPTLISGDRVIVNKLAYSVRAPFTLLHLARWGSPARGDVITFDSPKDDVNLIKRVIAVQGDVIEMHDNTIFINGKAMQRHLIDASRIIPTEHGALNAEVWGEQIGDKRIEVARIDQMNRHRDFEAVKVPVGHVMVMGDSRDNSNDSRFIGFIDLHRVTGQAVRVAMSHNPDLFYLPRADRWWLAL
jgi:signal peptidase I